MTESNPIIVLLVAKVEQISSDLMIVTQLLNKMSEGMASLGQLELRNTETLQKMTDVLEIMSNTSINNGLMTMSVLNKVVECLEGMRERT